MGVGSVAKQNRKHGPLSQEAARAFQRVRVAHWNAVALRAPRSTRWARAYHDRLTQVYQWLVPPGQRVLELGCGAGDLLAAVRPADGVGIDFAQAMVTVARRDHPQLRFIESDVHEIDLAEQFDLIILSDLVNDLWDVQHLFERLRPLCHPGTRVVLNFHNKLWQPLLSFASRLRLCNATLTQSWLNVHDVSNLLYLAGFQTVRHWEEVLWPLRTPWVDALCNRVLVKTWPFGLAALTHFLVARPGNSAGVREHSPTVSVIVPARNEAGNVAQILERIPRFGREPEIVFVEGHSTDDTYTAIERAIAAHPERRCLLIKQPGQGKGDAVREGLARASGNILIILDADLTVAPEDLPRFYDALRSGRGEFVNGVRLVYPMQDSAMRVFNLAANKFFALVFSWLLGQPIKDTLCGTKALWKHDYTLIAALRDEFGMLDPFGDFDLLFGAARLGSHIVDLPIRYEERRYGHTNIRRWAHGWLLLRMALRGARRLKMV